MAQRLQHPQAARLLLHDKARRVLKPFLKTTCTVTQAAQTAALPPNVAAYWVKKLLEQGMLRRVGQGQGTLYQATDTAYFAPFAVLDAESVAGLYRELMQPFEEVFAHSISTLMADPQADWGVCLSVTDKELVLTVVDETSNLTLNARHPAAPATLNLWGNLTLDFAEAKALQHDLIEVYQRYLGKTGGQRYTLRLGMVPLVPRE